MRPCGGGLSRTQVQRVVDKAVASVTSQVDLLEVQTGFVANVNVFPGFVLGAWDTVLAQQGSAGALVPTGVQVVATGLYEVSFNILVTSNPPPNNSTRVVVRATLAVNGATAGLPTSVVYIRNFQNNSRGSLLLPRYTLPLSGGDIVGVFCEREGTQTLPAFIVDNDGYLNVRRVA